MPSTRFSDALVYAAALHAQQQRKLSGEPYLAHLLAVAAIAMEYGGSEDEAIAALLHDAVEDQGGLATRRKSPAGSARRLLQSSMAAPTRRRAPSRRGGGARRRFSPGCKTPQPRSAALSRPTSCTMAGRFSASIAGWASALETFPRRPRGDALVRPRAWPIR